MDATFVTIMDKFHTSELTRDTWFVLESISGEIKIEAVAKVNIKFYHHQLLYKGKLGCCWELSSIYWKVDNFNF